MANTVTIGGRRVGPGEPCFIIAEVGLAHDGSLGAAHAYVAAAADAGATAIKFQTHIAEAESTPDEPFRVKTFPQDSRRYDYWVRTGFERGQWLELADHTRERGLVFLSSPFSFEAMDWLSDCNVGAWKVASGEVCNYPMLRRMASTGLAVLISSGMSGWAEIDRAVASVRDEGGECAVFQCTTSYPCLPEKWGLNIIPEMIERYGCPVGMSDHSGTQTPSLAAVMMGASLLEFHVTFDRKQFGPDVPASLTFEETASLTRSIRDLETAWAHPVDKDEIARGMQELRDIFTKSVVPARDLPAGTVLGSDELALRKPGTGIPAAEYENLIGMRLTRDVERNELISLDDIERP